MRLRLGTRGKGRLTGDAPSRSDRWQAQWKAASLFAALLLSHSLLRSRRSRVLLVAWLLTALTSTAARAAPQVVDVAIGIDGQFKRGLWTPARVTVEGASGLEIVLIAPDNDGVGVRYSARAAATDEQQVVPLLMRLGRKGAAVEARLYDEHRLVAVQTLSPESSASTSRLVVEVAKRSDAVLPSRIRRQSESPTAVAVVSDPVKLPDNHWGYEAVECVWLDLAGSDALMALDADSPQLAALEKWVQGGGRLVLAGANALAEDVAQPPSGLLRLLPGSVDSIVTLRDPSAIEEYSESNVAVAPGRRLALPVAQLGTTEGRIEAYADGSARRLPLVVRKRYGFGEVVVLTINLTSEPLKSWRGRSALVAKVCGLDRSASDQRASNSPSTLMTSGTTDLAGALQQRLGASFEGAQSASMLAVISAALVYLTLIGPVDYYFLRRMAQRMEFTWLTFPAVAAIFGLGAYWWAEQPGADQPRYNRVEFVDIDTESGVARGLMLCQAFSPSANRFDIQLTPRWANESPVSDASHYVSWLGVPGAGLSGLDAKANTLAAMSAEYQQSGSGENLAGVPINTRSTKALVARWQASAVEGIEADLRMSGYRLAEGSLTNRLGVVLQDAWLTHGEWAWRLGDLADDDTVTIDDSTVPIALAALIREDYLTTSPSQGSPEVTGMTTDGVAALMMFTRSLAATGYTELSSRLLPRTDLSPALQQGRAILVARVAAETSSQLTHQERPWSPSTDRDRVYYRFVLPVRAP